MNNKTNENLRKIMEDMATSERNKVHEFFLALLESFPPEAPKPKLMYVGQPMLASVNKSKGYLTKRNDVVNRSNGHLRKDQELAWEHDEECPSHINWLPYEYGMQIASEKCQLLVFLYYTDEKGYSFSGVSTDMVAYAVLSPPEPFNKDVMP